MDRKRPSALLLLFLCLSIFAAGVPRPAYTDNLSSPTRIKAVHITELQQRAQ